jgi:hypothetical protein
MVDAGTIVAMADAITDEHGMRDDEARVLHAMLDEREASGDLAAMVRAGIRVAHDIAAE